MNIQASFGLWKEDMIRQLLSKFHANLVGEMVLE